MLNSSTIGKGVSEYLPIVRTTSSLVCGQDNGLRPKLRDNLLTVIPLLKISFGTNVIRNLRAEFEHCMLIGWRWAIGLLQYMAGEPLWDCLSSPSSSYTTTQFPRRYHFLNRAANSLGAKSEFAIRLPTRVNRCRPLRLHLLLQRKPRAKTFRLSGRGSRVYARGFSSGSYKPRQLGSLHIQGRRRSTSKPSVFGADQTISESGSRILPDEKRLLDRRFILESNISRC